MATKTIWSTDNAAYFYVRKVSNGVITSYDDLVASYGSPDTQTYDVRAVVSI